MGARDVFVFQYACAGLRQYLSDAHGTVQYLHDRDPVCRLLREPNADFRPDVYLSQCGVLHSRDHVFLRRVHCECRDFVLPDRLRRVPARTEKNAVKNRSVPQTVDPARRTVFALQGDFHMRVGRPDLAQRKIGMLY